MTNNIDQTEQGSAEESQQVEAARNGDRAAFNWLVLRHQAHIYNRCLYLLRDPDSAADASQEAFLSAFVGMPNFKGGYFRAWLTRIATNACIDMLRARGKARKRTQSLDLEIKGAAPLQIADPNPMSDPLKAVLYEEAAAAIGRGLESLVPATRRVLLLVGVRDLSYRKAADLATGGNTTALKSRIHHGRVLLRSYLKQQDMAS